MRATRRPAVVCAAVFSLVLGCDAGAVRSAEPAPGAAAALPAGAAVVYDDALRSGWTDASWGATRNWAATAPVASGTRALSVQYARWGGLYLRRVGASVAGKTTLSLMVNAGSNVGLRLVAVGVQGSTGLAPVDLATYCAARAFPANAWTRCDVPLSALLPAGTVLDGFWIQERNGTSHPAVFFDDIGLTGTSTPPPPPPPPPPVSVAIAPASAAVDACTKAKFTATVTGATDPSVVWSVQEGAAGGSVDAAGNYTAPSTPGTYHLVARSNASSTATATATAEVLLDVLSVTVDPVSANLAPGSTLQLSATVTTTCGTFQAY
jgi:chitinase